MEREVTADNTRVTIGNPIGDFDDLKNASRDAKKYFGKNFELLFKPAFANSYTLNDFIEQRNTRMIALNALGGNTNEQTV